MTDEILALVEERPYTILELAATLGVNQWTLRDRVAQLEAHGQLFVERGHRPALVSLPNAATRRSSRRPGMSVDARAPHEPSSGTQICASYGCGKRFTPWSKTDEFCSEACRQEARRPPASVIRVVNGVEYEATSIGAHPLGEWPDDLRHDSSLANPYAPTDRSRHEW